MFFLAGTIKFWCSGYTASSIFQLTLIVPHKMLNISVALNPVFQWKNVQKQRPFLSLISLFHSFCTWILSENSQFSVLFSRSQGYYFLSCACFIYRVYYSDLKVDRRCLASPGKIHYEGVRNRHSHGLAPSQMHPPWGPPSFWTVLLWLVSQTRNRVCYEKGWYVFTGMVC